MVENRAVPAWLLNELSLVSGVFITRTRIKGLRNDHSYAVARIDPNEVPSRQTTVDLTARSDWEAIEKRLACEGY